MKKYMAYLLILGILIAPVTAFAVNGTTETGGGSSGSIDWTSAVGDPDSDPNAPDSYEEEYDDTLTTPENGGLGGNRTSG